MKGMTLDSELEEGKYIHINLTRRSVFCLFIFKS